MITVDAKIVLILDIAGIDDVQIHPLGTHHIFPGLRSTSFNPQPSPPDDLELFPMELAFVYDSTEVTNIEIKEPST